MSVTQVERSFIADKEKLLLETWRYTGTLATSNGDNVISSNWERADDSFTGHINGAMTESSGVFTFPYTGFFRITFHPYFYSNSQGHSSYVGATIMATRDATNYTSIVEKYDSLQDNLDHAATSNTFTFDVTNVSNDKVKFNAYSENDATVIGNTSTNKTYVTFEFMGDT